MGCTRLHAPNRGYVLVAVLWVLAGVSALGLQASLVARETIVAARNRADLTRAAWQAEDCLERTRVLIDAALKNPAPPTGLPHGWASLDLLDLTVVRPRVGSCDVEVRPAGATLDVNAATPEQLIGLFRALGVAAAAADSLASAILDWIDPDDLARPHGVEQPWYRSGGRKGPRNGGIADIRELQFIRGLEHFQGLDLLLGVEPGRVSLAHAPPTLLRALRGLAEETVARILETRGRAGGAVNLAAVAGEVHPAAGAALLQHYADLMATTTSEPDAWIVASRASAGSPPVTTVVQVRLLRANTRAAVVRRRTWME